MLKFPFKLTGSIPSLCCAVSLLPLTAGMVSTAFPLSAQAGSIMYGNTFSVPSRGMYPSTPNRRSRPDRYDREHNNGYPDREIEDVILINPIIINSEIEDSTQINPIIIDSDSRPSRGFYSGGGSRFGCTLLAEYRAACQ